MMKKNLGTRIIKGLLLLCLLYVGTLESIAQEETDDFRNNRNLVECFGTLSIYGSDPAYSVGFSYYWYPCYYVGLGSGFFFQSWGEIVGEVLPYTIRDKQNREFNFDDDNRILKGGLYLGPSFRTPSFRIGKDRDVRFFVQCNPSLLFSIPNDRYIYSHTFLKDSQLYKESIRLKNQEGKWCFWQIRTAASVAIDKAVLSLGYGLSNFGPFSGSRNVIWENRNISKPNSDYAVTHELFISVAYSF